MLAIKKITAILFISTMLSACRQPVLNTANPKYIHTRLNNKNQKVFFKKMNIAQLVTKLSLNTNNSSPHVRPNGDLTGWIYDMEQYQILVIFIKKNYISNYYLQNIDSSSIGQNKISQIIIKNKKSHQYLNLKSDTLIIN